MITAYQKQWQFLKKSAELEKVSHAYLFLGPEHLGKKTVAIEFIKLLNCQDKMFSNRPCQICRSCKDIEAQTHPDFFIISPETDEIQISQIRELRKALVLHSFSARYKSVIIDQAEKMNREAASALLKTLEEPRGRTIFILICRSAEMLLPTIFSRCQLIKFYPKEPQKFFDQDKRIKEIISLNKSNLAVRFQYAKELSEEKENINEVLNIWLNYFRNILIKTINGQSKDYSLAKLNKIIKAIEQTNLLISSTNVNPKLALEILMLEL